MQILIHLVFNELSGEIISITFYFYNIRMGKPNITKHKAYNREWKELIVLSIKIKWFCKQKNTINNLKTNWKILFTPMTKKVNI